MLAVALPSFSFAFVDVGRPGRVGDNTMMRFGDVQKFYGSLQEQYHILGDKEFALSPWPEMCTI